MSSTDASQARWKRPVGIGLMIVGLVTGLALLVPWAHVAVRSWGRVFGDATQAPREQAAIVLGARVHADGRPSAFLSERLAIGLHLYETGRVERIIVSGANTPESHHETDVMQDWLISRGVPAGRVINDPHGYDTYDSCVRAKEVYGVSSVTLVSQSYHLPRAVTICREIGLDAVGVGGERAKRWPYNWYKGVAREQVANLKMEWDLVTRRVPNLER